MRRGIAAFGSHTADECEWPGTRQEIESGDESPHCKGGFHEAAVPVECVGGDFDLSEALARAVAGRLKVASGELQCRGTCKRGDRDLVPCQTLLRYKLNLAYDGSEVAKR